MEKFSNIPLQRFTGHLDSSLIDAKSGVFVSSSLTNPIVGNELQVASVETINTSFDHYDRNKSYQAPNQKPLVLGPATTSGRPYPPDFKTTAPTYVPVFNSSFVFMGTKTNNVTGLMHDTVLLTDTVIFY